MHTCSSLSSLSSLMNEVIDRAARRLAAWQFADHLRKHAISFHQAAPCALRIESAAGWQLSPIKESEGESAQNEAEGRAPSPAIW